MEDKPLLNDSEGKRPTLLYIIIAVLAVAVIALIIVVAVKNAMNVAIVRVMSKTKYLMTLLILFP